MISKSQNAMSVGVAERGFQHGGLHKQKAAIAKLKAIDQFKERKRAQQKTTNQIYEI